MQRRAFLVGLMFLVLGVVPGFSVQDTQKKETCSVCRMTIDKRTHFIGNEKGKPVHFCSFICALQYRLKDPKAPLKVLDYTTGKEVDADQASFLVKSQNIEKELGFGMPPLVVAFEKKSDADEAQKRLKDGNVVKGFLDVQKTYQ